MEEKTDKQINVKRSWRHSLSPLERVTAFAVLGAALMYLIYTLLVYFAAVLIIPLVIITAIVFVAAGIAFIGLRWTAIVGALITLAMTIGSYAQPFFPDDLKHPGSPGQFIPVVILTIFVVVAIVAGIAATIENYRVAPLDRRASRSLGPMLTGVAGIVIGVILVSLIAAANPQTTSASTSANGEPTVHMGVVSFETNVVLVPKGSKLMIVDDGQFTHILQNGTWNGTSPQNLTETGAPTVNNLNISGGSVEIGPFVAAGVYHIYCTIHVKMDLTIVVQ